MTGLLTGIRTVSEMSLTETKRETVGSMQSHTQRHRVCAAQLFMVSMSRSKQYSDRKKEVCLIDAFRSLGMKQIGYHCDGPFWAMDDGNKMLKPHGCLGLLLER